MSTSLYLQAKHVSFRYTDHPDPLITDLNLSLYQGERIALIGANGSGKTTLLQLFAGVLLADAGEVGGELLRSGADVRWFAQETPVDEARTVAELFLAERQEWLESYRKMGGLEPLTHPLAYADAVGHFAALGGFTRLQQAEAELAKLGHPPDTLDRPTEQLSGGERRLLTLLAGLLNPPDLLLLDEPTNDLDERGALQLVARLREVPSACVIVSHDRWFLDQLVSGVVELKHHRARYYRGDYSTVRATQRAERQQQVRQKERLEGEIDRLKEMERHYKVWGVRKEKEKSGAFDKGFIGARAARLTKRGILAKERLAKRAQTLEETKPWVDKHYTLSFEPVTTPTGRCLVVRDLAHTFTADHPPLFQHVMLDIAWGERVALSGANGSGKSTLLHLLSGQLTPQLGTVLWSKRTRLGYLPQRPPTPNSSSDDTPAAALFNRDETPDARIRLGVLGVHGDDFARPLCLLSEGQRRKVALVRLILDRPNVLLLDEPTNHLDLESVERLEAALADFGGTLVLASHDRYLRERLCERKVVIGDARV